ncbi:hypothetical protein OG226_00595 [Streptomyces sp. NBC_01261]|uniref:hypothetical protein n=1 Tax=Streptomyces sp. NBC_01261 TaxID=2903802 RepID=UPI002E2F19AE|nr:hypothetical protein [Streptomyces sp. NBC_01261]
MNRVLSVASRLSLLVFLLGGTIVTFGQIAGIAAGDGDLVMKAATRVGEPTCVTAGIAGLLAFVRVYFKSEQREREAEPVPELPKQRT